MIGRCCRSSIGRSWWSDRKAAMWLAAASKASLASGGPALGGIVEHLKKVPYLSEIVVALGHASALEFRRAKDYFKVLPQDVRLIWIEGPRIQEALNLLVSQDIDVGRPGKG